MPTDCLPDRAQYFLHLLSLSDQQARAPQSAGRPGPSVFLLVRPGTTRVRLTLGILVPQRQSLASVSSLLPGMHFHHKPQGLHFLQEMPVLRCVLDTGYGAGAGDPAPTHEKAAEAQRFIPGKA